ncbi:hypothetical protein OUZ56_020338 [Daphnia magna]|uniref:Uncharacterized protein n=1 Tax=Daphnia magna TaxID=35525 RepID=A0ABQ9ZE86_9CRUS|nr:hypothetical protein OUZ56_020338 [Daphnia magna]
MVHGLPVYLLHPSAESQTNILSGKDLRGILAIVGLLIMKIIRKKYRGRELLRDDFDFALVVSKGINTDCVLTRWCVLRRPFGEDGLHHRAISVQFSHIELGSYHYVARSKEKDNGSWNNVTTLTSPKLTRSLFV